MLLYASLGQTRRTKFKTIQDLSLIDLTISLSLSERRVAQTIDSKDGKSQYPDVSMQSNVKNSSHGLFFCFWEFPLLLIQESLMFHLGPCVTQLLGNKSDRNPLPATRESLPGVPPSILTTAVSSCVPSCVIRQNSSAESVIIKGVGHLALEPKILIR